MKYHTVEQLERVAKVRELPATLSFPKPSDLSVGPNSSKRALTRA